MYMYNISSIKERQWPPPSFQYNVFKAWYFIYIVWINIVIHWKKKTNLHIYWTLMRLTRCRVIAL